MEGFHPETIKVEDFDWDISCLHSLEEGVHGRFVIAGRETCAEPETVTPCWDLIWFPGYDGIFVKNLFWSWAVNNVPDVC